MLPVVCRLRDTDAYSGPLQDGTGATECEQQQLLFWDTHATKTIGEAEHTCVCI